MSLPDAINGAFELLGGVAVLGHCRRLHRDKIVRGASWAAVAFFQSWGLWNLFYYPHLDQWLSFTGGLLIVSANTLWLGMMLYYIRRERRWQVGAGQFFFGPPDSSRENRHD